MLQGLQEISWRGVRAIVLVVIVTATLAGCLGGDDQEEVKLEPAEDDAPSTFTVEEKLTRGDILTWTWSSSSPVTFLVQDPDGEVVSSRTSEEDVGRVEATTYGRYLFMWINELNGSTVLRYEVETERSAPGPSGPVVIASLAAVTLLALALSPPRRAGGRPDPSIHGEEDPPEQGWGQPLRDRVMASVREEVAERTRHKSCALCGAFLPDANPDRPEVCSACNAPDAATVYELAARLGIVRQCTVCGEWVANLLLHYAVGGGAHPKTRYEAPTSSAWIFQLLNIEITTSEVVD